MSGGRYASDLQRAETHHQEVKAQFTEVKANWLDQ